MGTPLPFRLILSPRAAASVSPLINKKSPINLKIPENHHKSVRRLQFLSPTNSPLKTSVQVKKATETEVSALKRNKQLLGINTPEKAQLLKFGLPDRSILHVLGSGTFGTVVEGKYKGEVVAVKVIKRQKNIRESHVLNLSHQNIVKTIDVLSKDNETYCLVVMEYWAGSRPLQSVLDDRSINLTFKIDVDFVLDICKGLQYCHSNGILHLDLKPSNVLVCPNGVCKLCDFGSCFKYNEENIYEHKGTIKYTSPEILQGKIPSVKSDVYSLGITLWQVRYREIPFQNEASNEVIIYKVVKFGLRPCAPNCVHDSYCELYCKCWQADPDGRPSVSTVIICLENM